MNRTINHPDKTEIGTGTTRARPRAPRDRIRAALLGALCASTAICALSSCNLLFLKLGYKNETPKVDMTVDVIFPSWAPVSLSVHDGYLWPVANFTATDDLGIAKIECKVVSDDGEASFVMENTDPRSRYVWSSSRPLADVLGFGTNFITFTVTDADGLTESTETEYGAWADGSCTGAFLGTDMSEIYLWHPNGVATASYRYTFGLDGENATAPIDLVNLDDGSGPGGSKLFKGKRYDLCPVGDRFIVFHVTLRNGQEFDTRYIEIGEGN